MLVSETLRIKKNKHCHKKLIIFKPLWFLSKKKRQSGKSWRGDEQFSFVARCTFSRTNLAKADLYMKK